MSNMPPPPHDPYQQPMGGPGQTVAQPSSIATAVKLMYVGAGLSLLGLVVSVVTIGSLRDEIGDSLRESDSSVSQSTIDAAVTLGIVFGVFFGLVGVALWLWMAWKNGQGRSWARVVATVLGVINVLATLYSLLAGRATVGSQILSVLNVIVAIAILVLLYRKESSDFYQARSNKPVYG